MCLWCLRASCGRSKPESRTAVHVWYHFCEEEGGGWGFTSIRKLKGSSQNSIESLLKEKPHLAQAGISLKSFCFLSGGVATPVRALKPPLDTIIDSSNTTSSDPGKHQTSEGICVSSESYRLLRRVPCCSVRRCFGGWCSDRMRQQTCRSCNARSSSGGLQVRERIGGRVIIGRGLPTLTQAG